MKAILIHGNGGCTAGDIWLPWLEQRWVAIYNSTDDPHIPIAEPRFVAKQLRCSYFEFTDRGHFVDSRQFPEVVDLVRRKLSL